jgi:OmpA-OmpF porin, OOP family
MKKIVLSALLASAVLSASDYNYEISPMIGYAYSNGIQELRDHTVFAGEMQFNNLFDSAIKPELSLMYSDADRNDELVGDVDIFRSAINGVYEFAHFGPVTPFVKAGAGFETMSDHLYGNHNGFFVDAGAGLKVPLTQQLSLKLEAIEIQKYDHSNWDNTLIVLGGLNFAFGAKAQPAAPVVAAVAAPVVAAVVAEPKKPEPKPVVVAEAPVAKICLDNVDTDKDGVFDPQDKCPSTPAGFKVDADGCPLKATLHLNFVTDGHGIDAGGTAKVTEFAAFLKDSPAYKANIIGHTDSTASDKYNQKLSEKRANIVKGMLVDQGIAADRLTTSGKGETMPVASNKTKQGRAENRRIEVELTH